MVSRAHKDESLARIRAAGVVGAGGSGYPTHLKLRAAADTVIANGAECEPLLEKDLHLMERRTARLLDGMARAAELVGAKRRIIAVKKKRGELLEPLRQACGRRRGFEVAGLDDTYPSGDEFLLVHALTGRRPPPGGFPTEVGVLVQNVETLVNLAAALDGEPVTETWLTVCGAVRRPYTAAVPLGAPVGDLLAQAGGYAGGAGAVDRPRGGRHDGTAGARPGPRRHEDHRRPAVPAADAPPGPLRHRAGERQARRRPLGVRPVQLLHAVLSALPARLRRRTASGHAGARLRSRPRRRFRRLGQPLLRVRPLRPVRLPRGSLAARCLPLDETRAARGRRRGPAGRRRRRPTAARRTRCATAASCRWRC